MTIRGALDAGVRLLEETEVAVPRLTAEVLLCHVLGRERSYLYGHPEEALDSSAELRYRDALERRAQGAPTQYITGRQEFYGREFQVTPDVFIPRPETEHVVETALRLAPEAGSIVDVGCGSGAIAVTLSLEMNRTVRATDVSRAAIRVAAANARRLCARVEFVACDLASAFAAGSLDLLVSNPPYIPAVEEEGLPREVREHEPRLALYGGPAGLDAYRQLVRDAARVLKPGGWIVFELGHRQVEAVREMLDSRWTAVEVAADLAGLPRVFAARFQP
jgi:release factor glutamine methyltransferase